jgi:hypothetical protein
MISESNFESRFDLKSPRILTFYVLSFYKPLHRIQLSLRATATNLVVRYGQLWQIWLCAKGHCVK